LRNADSRARSLRDLADVVRQGLDLEDAEVERTRRYPAQRAQPLPAFELERGQRLEERGAGRRFVQPHLAALRRLLVRRERIFVLVAGVERVRAEVMAQRVLVVPGKQLGDGRLVGVGDDHAHHGGGRGVFRLRLDDLCRDLGKRGIHLARQVQEPEQHVWVV
jgi:hypothetical protein